MLVNIVTSVQNQGKLLNILINSMKKNKFEDTKVTIRIFDLSIQLQVHIYNVIVIENVCLLSVWKIILIEYINK